MNVLGGKTKGLKISFRIAIFAWLVTLMTVGLFVLVIIPQQRRTFIETLHSKANSVAVSLRDVAAGAALNEDFASIVMASETLLRGDQSLDFLIILRNDGFAIINEQNSWRVETVADALLLPERREVFGSIRKIPLLDRRVYHYAQPFDYSGIEWGWIHVGLSLQGYDESVREMYINTLLIALICIFFSFLLSLIYAKRMVRQIHHLREVVRKVADGNLTVRAEAFHQDELGDLGDSVNIMIESLHRRDRIMEGLRFAGQELMSKDSWEDGIADILRTIGQATKASRAYIFENHRDEANRLLCSQRYEWTAPGIKAELHNPLLQNLSYSDFGLKHLVEELSAEQTVHGLLSDMRLEEQDILAPQDVLSIILVPIFFEGVWWGFLGLDDCKTKRIWSDTDRESLRALADLLGATNSRQLFQKALIESKATLEQRVDERTQELQDQVQVKEKALLDLAAAQSSLLEMSRSAGMAEVATGVLHNVGNVLNSVNVSCTLIRDQLRESRVANVSRVAALMTEHKEDLPRFLSEEPRGRQIPAYLGSLGSALEEEYQTLSREAESLHERMDHIKEIVTMQQGYGRVLGIEETISPQRLMEDALMLNSGELLRHSITIERDYGATAPLLVDKHKVLQILLNLINNAMYACDGKEEGEKIITLRIFLSGPDRLSMQVNDNGTGIAPENLTRIFRHGFTTRRNGYGFGLHSGALAAKDLGGSLTVRSEGPGLGASFTLELPLQSRSDGK